MIKSMTHVKVKCSGKAAEQKSKAEKGVRKAEWFLFMHFLRDEAKK